MAEGWLRNAQARVLNADLNNLFAFPTTRSSMPPFGSYPNRRYDLRGLYQVVYGRVVRPRPPVK
jgi:hypothetical protein